MNIKKKRDDFIGIRETLFDSDYAILRCLLYCAFDNDFQEDSPEITTKDEKTRTSLINFLESNNRICKFIESLLANLRNPNDKNPNEVLRTDGEDTWFITYYLKKLSMPYMKEIVIPMIALADKALQGDHSEEKKNEIAVDLCQQFVRLMFKRLDTLPKVFFGVLSSIKNHFTNSWKDAIVSLIFLRMLYPAILTSDTYFVDQDKSPSTTPTKKKTVPEININTRKNINLFLKFFKIAVSNPHDDDPLIKNHSAKLIDIHKSILDFISKVCDAEKFQKKLNKEKKLKNGSKKTQSIVLSLKMHANKLSTKINDYATSQSSFKINIKLLIEFLKEKSEGVPVKKKPSSVKSSPNVYVLKSQETRRISDNDYCFEDRILVELAPKILSDPDPEESNPYTSIKKTLRRYKTFTRFKEFLKEEFNAEAIELYYHILKHKKIQKNEENFRLSSLKFIYSTFINANGKYSFSIPSDITEKYNSVLNDDSELLANDDDLITKLLNFVYFFLKEPHGRFLIEKSSLKKVKQSNSYEDI